MTHHQSTFVIDAALREIASVQLGLVTAGQAERAGVDRHALARRISAHAVVPVFSHVYRLAVVPATQPQRVLAAALIAPGATIAATSAAVVHGIPVPTRVMDGQLETVLSVGSRQLVRHAGITAIRHTHELPSRRWMSVRVATPEATLLLLPRFLRFDAVEHALDHCLAHRLLTVERMFNLIRRLPPTAVKGRAGLLELLDARSNGIGHRSGLERQVAGWLNTSGLSGWIQNHRVLVAGNEHVEVDFGWEDERVALEVSPFFTHGSRRVQERDAKRRRLLTDVGWRVVEATDPDLANRAEFARTAETIRRLLRPEFDHERSTGAPYGTNSPEVRDRAR